MSTIQDQAAEVLRVDALHALLRLLNARTPHRFTGVFRYDGDILRSVCLFDRSDSALRKGSDYPMQDTYCSRVASASGALEFSDIDAPDAPIRNPKSPVVSYCGVLIRDAQGRGVGTLCHYDVLPCQERVSDRELLEALSPLIFAAMGPAPIPSA